MYYNIIIKHAKQCMTAYNHPMPGPEHMIFQKLSTYVAILQIGRYTKLFTVNKRREFHPVWMFSHKQSGYLIDVNRHAIVAVYNG